MAKYQYVKPLIILHSYFPRHQSTYSPRKIALDSELFGTGTMIIDSVCCPKLGTQDTVIDFA